MAVSDSFLTIVTFSRNKSNTLSFESQYNYTAIDISPNGSTLLAINESKFNVTSLLRTKNVKWPKVKAVR